jgi:hypothetical protein
MPLYDKIGADYNKTRQADIIIFNRIYELLDYPNNKKIIDIGAGTGNYSSLLLTGGIRKTILKTKYETEYQHLVY